MFKLSKSKLLGIVAVVIALLSVAPQADAAYSWGTSSVTRNGSVMGYGYGSVTGQLMQITSTANTRRTTSLDGRGVYSYVNTYQTGANAQFRNFRHPNATGTSYTQTVQRANYSTPTHLPWSARARVCVDLALQPDQCGTYTTPGAVY